MGGWKRVKDKLTVFLIRHSPYFDEDYYRRHVGVSETIDAASHYYDGGWRIADPSAQFGQERYLAANEDVRAADVCPLGHYLLYGRMQHRRLGPDAVSARYHSWKAWRGIQRVFYEAVFHRTIRKNRGQKILVVAHIYYEEALPEVMEYLKNLRVYQYDLVVTTTKDRDIERIKDSVAAMKAGAAVRVFENRGFDIGPYLTVLQDTNLSDYDIVIKIQTKRLFHVDARPMPGMYFRSRDWFVYLMESALGARYLHRNIHRMTRDEDIWLTAAENLLVKDTVNRERLTRYRLKQRGIELHEGYSFAAGSCFLIRADKAREHQRLSVSSDDLEITTRDKYTLAHALERYLTGIIPDEHKHAVRVCGLRRKRAEYYERSTGRKRSRELRDKIEGYKRAHSNTGETGSTLLGSIKIAFAVQDANDDLFNTNKVDLLKLIKAMEAKDCQTVMLTQLDPVRPWEYVGDDVDALISTAYQYPLRSCVKCSEGLIRVALAMDHFDQWMESEETGSYDFIITSNPAVREEMEIVLDKKVKALSGFAGNEFSDDDYEIIANQLIEMIRN